MQPTNYKLYVAGDPGSPYFEIGRYPNLPVGGVNAYREVSDTEGQKLAQQNYQLLLTNPNVRGTEAKDWLNTTMSSIGTPKSAYETYKDPFTGEILKNVSPETVAQIEQQQADLAAGRIRQIAPGMFVPTGSASDTLNQQIQFGTYQNQPTSVSPQQTQTPQFNIGNTVLSIGSKDKASVMELQKALNASGVGVNLKVDGIYGPATKAAVEAYQRANNLKVDGIVGQQTLGQLRGTPTPLSPVNAAITDVTSNNPLYNNLTPELKGLFDQLTMQISSLVEQGQRVNPNLEITPEMTARFLDQATKELDPYYQELIRQNKQDLSTSFQQLQQDYQTNIQREEPAFQQALESQDINEAEAGLAFSSGRQEREQAMIGGQQQRLEDLFQSTQRGVQKLATEGERKIGSRAFADLGIPSLQQYSAKRSIFAPKNIGTGTITSTGSRQLYTPQTGLFGELPAQSKTTISTRSSELEEAERKKRLLDYSTKFGLGSSYLG